MKRSIGRYETLGVLGGGGMATVYVGRAVGAGGFERLVALKVMHPHLAVDPEFVAMFLDEARLAARIRHPNVVPTLDVQQDDGALFLVMEYVEGPSLDELLRTLRKTSTPLPLEVALRIFLDLLAGLHAAHELIGPEGTPLGLVHRDVSPHNVLVGVDGIARITDFGVALATARLATTKFGHVKGKIAYAPPEQVLLETLDRRADIYAAGAVLWEMLAGEPLFASENDLALGSMVLDGAKHSPRDKGAKIPEALDAACMRALHVDRDQRFATAADLSDAIEAAAESAGIRVAPSRTLAALVKATAAHRPPPARETVPSLGDDVARFSSASNSAPRPWQSEAPTAQSSVTNLDMTSSRPPRSSPRLKIALAVAGVTALGVAAIAIAVRPVPTPAPSSAGEPAPTPRTSASASSVPASPPVTSTDPVLVPASASASAIPSAPPRGGDTRGQGRPGKPGAPFRPKEL